MVMVKQPFWSGWASGSIAKTITCRAMGYQKFCMHRFRHTQNKRSPGQIWAQERFTKKLRLYQSFVWVSDHRSARLGLNYPGISILGADHTIAMVLPKIPPLKEEE